MDLRFTRIAKTAIYSALQSHLQWVMIFWHDIAGKGERARARRWRRRVGGEWDGCFPFPANYRVWGSVVSSLGGVRGGAQAEIEFCKIWMPNKPSGGTYFPAFKKFDEFGSMHGPLAALDPLFLQRWEWNFAWRSRSTPARQISPSLVQPVVHAWRKT